MHEDQRDALPGFRVGKVSPVDPDAPAGSLFTVEGGWQRSSPSTGFAMIKEWPAGMNSARANGGDRE